MKRCYIPVTAENLPQWEQNKQNMSQKGIMRKKDTGRQKCRRNEK